MESSRTACRFYARGSCTKGTRCPYLHSQWQATEPTSPSSSTSKVARPCMFFARGICSKGISCTYSHESDLETALAPVAHHSEGRGQHDHVPGDSRPQVPCWFFAKGKCLKGVKCIFSHAGDTEAAGTVTGVSEVRINFEFHLL
jgi:hypothetical protein